MMTQAYVTSGSNLITKFQSQRKEKRGADTGHTLLHYFKDFSFSCLLTLPIVIGCFLLSLKFLSQQRTKQGSTKTNNYKQVVLLLLINNWSSACQLTQHSQANPNPSLLLLSLTCNWWVFPFLFPFFGSEKEFSN
jgi:ACR3 family arsenite efflux pump ArsB